MPGTMRPNPLTVGWGSDEQGIFKSGEPVTRPGKANPFSLKPFDPNGGGDLDSPAGQPGDAGDSSAQQDYSQEGPGVMPQLLKENASATDALAKLKTSAGRLQGVMDGLTKLGEMGDTVEIKDVVDQASRFITLGLGAKAIAAVLVDAPTQSQEALAGWVGQLGQHVAQLQAANNLAIKNAGFDLANNGMKLLLAGKAQSNSAKMQGGAQPQGGGAPPPDQSGGAPPDQSGAPSPDASAQPPQGM